MEYLPVLFFLGVGILIGSVILLLTHLLGPKNPTAMKSHAFECGVPPVGDARRRMSVRFYLVAILFLLFDVEVLFFYPWALVFRDFMQVNAFIFWEMIFFVILLMVGFIYVLRRGALEWD